MEIAYERLKGFIPTKFEDKPFDLYVPFFRNEKMLINILEDYEVNHVYAICAEEGRAAFFNSLVSQAARLMYEVEELQRVISEEGAEKRKEIEHMYTSPDCGNNLWLGAAWKALKDSTPDGKITPIDKAQYLQWKKALFKSNAQFICSDFASIEPSDPKNSLFYIDRPEDLGYLDKVRLSEYKAKVHRMGAEIIRCY